MRFLHTGDWHVGKSLRGRSRVAEHRAVLSEIVDVARDQRVDIVLIAGDLFDTSSPTAESEEVVYRALLELARAIEWVVVISGNHDNPRRLEAVTPLMQLTNIRVLSSTSRPDDGGVLTLQTKRGAARIALLPFLSQRNIIKADDLMLRDAAEHIGTYATRASRIIAALCSDASPPKTVNLLLAHAMVHGGVMGGGEREAHTVFEYSVPAAAFPSSLDYAALGHLHRAQKIPGACPIWYAGSPLQLDFGESEDSKSVNIIEVGSSTPASVESIPLVAGRRLRFIRAQLEQLPALASEVGDDYLRVELDGKPTLGLADRVRELLPNAVDVQVATPRDVPSEAERPKRLGRSPRELFAEYLSERGEDDVRLRALFDEILDEVYASN